MHKEEYLLKKEKELDKILNEEKLRNYANQIFAKKINANFEEQFDESYLWRFALYLSSKGCLLLEKNSENQVGIESLRKAAEIYENLHYVGTKYDQNYSLILSSLCYDISGYQANAKCLIDELVNKNDYYLLESDDDKLNILYYENKIIKTIQLFLQKKIFLILNELNQFEEYSNLPYYYISPLKKYHQALKSLSEFILNGKKTDFITPINDSYEEIFKTGNVFLSQIINLLKVRLLLLKNQNIWDVMEKQNKLPHPIWEKYLKILSMDIYGVNETKSEEKRTSIFEFWRSQINAIKNGVISTDENYVIQMPTSAGKTLIAEIMIIDSLIKNPDSKCIYIAPFRALASEIQETLSSRLDKLGFIVSNAVGSYEIDEFELFWIKNANVLIATPEKIDLLYRTKPEFFENISLVVVDEGHLMIVDETKLFDKKNYRSVLLEFLIVKLRRKLKGKSRFLFISAVMAEENSKELSKWLSGKDNNVISSPKIYGIEWEPTRKLIGVYQWYKSSNSGEIRYIFRDNLKNPYLPYIISENKYTYINPDSGLENNKIFPNKKSKSFKSETAVELAYKLIDEGSVLIFSSRPDWARSIGKRFLKLLDLKEKIGEDIKFPFKNKEDIESVETARKWLGDDDTVTKCLKKGIGIHYGSLSEPVRKAIERDFREKKIEMLISTNTIGQGVNFPIKTVIVHSLIRNPQKNEKVSIRDFWNIAGRAGRAGRETEGRIIFLIIKPKDQKLFAEYSNKKLIKNAVSPLVPLLKYLLIVRLNETTLNNFDNALRYYIEPHLLNILMEESVDTPDEDFIRDILGFSLFKIQSESKNYDITPMINRMVSIGKKFNSEVEDHNLRDIYSKTGFYITSCTKFSEFIKENIDSLKQIIRNDDYKSLLRKCISLFSLINEMSDEKIKTSIIKENEEKLIDFTLKWIEGKSINDLNHFWDNHFSEDKNLNKKIQNYINNFLEYRYPWGITVFLNILLYHLNECFEDVPKTLKDLPDKIKMLSPFVKYGFDKPEACIAKSIGVNSREACLEISKVYEGESNFEDFTSWFSNLDFEDVNELNLSKFEIKDILRVSQNLNVENWTDKYDYLECEVKGIAYNDHRKKISYEIQIGDELKLKRDFDNLYDIYAIKLQFKNNELGFVPRNITKIISTDMDLNDKKFKAEVINKHENKGYYSITIRISNI